MLGVIILNCSVCGTKLENDEQECLKCKEIENKVQVLTLEERQHFSGITVEQDEREEQGHEQYQASNANQHIYSRQFSIGNTSLLTKLFIGVILAGIIFIALPIAIFFISIVAIIAYIVRK